MTMRRHASPVFVSAGALSLLIFALGFAQNPNQAGNNQADNIVPLSASIKLLRNVPLPLGNTEYKVHIPYCLTNDTVVLFPVWVAEKPQIRDGAQWRRLELTEKIPTLINGQPPEIKFCIRNLLATEKTCDEIIKQLRKRLQERQGVKEVKVVEPDLREDGFYLSLFAARGGGPGGGQPDQPLCPPIRLSKACLSRELGEEKRIVLEYFPALTSDQEPICLKDIYIAIQGPFRSRFDLVNIEASLTMFKKSIVNLQNTIAPSQKSLGQPQFLAQLPLSAGGGAVQTVDLLELVTQWMQIEIRRRQDSKDRETLERLLSTLLDRAFEQVMLRDLNQNTVVYLILGNQAGITATLGQIKKLAQSERKAREQHLSQLLDNWEARQQGNKEKWQVDAELRLRPVSILFGKANAWGEQQEQRLDANQRKEHIDSLQRAFDELKNHFEGNVPVVAISLEQNSITKRIEQFQADIKQVQFTIGYALYEWPPLEFQGLSPATELMRLYDADRQLSLREKGLKDAAANAEKLMGELHKMQAQLVQQRKELEEHFKNQRREFEKKYQALDTQASEIEANIKALEKKLSQTEAAKLSEDLQKLREDLTTLRKEITALRAETPPLLGKLLHGKPINLPREVYSVAFLPKQHCFVAAVNGHLNANNNNVGEILVVDMITGAIIQPLAAQKDYVYSVAVTPDGRYVVSGSGDNTVRLWELATGKEVRQFKGHQRQIYSVTVTPDGKYAVSGSPDETMRLWDLATGQEVPPFTGHQSTVNSVAVTPDGKYVVSGSGDRTVRLWDLATGKVRQFNGHEGVVYSVAVTPDGKYVVSGSGDRTVRLWDLATGEVRKFEGHEWGVYSVAVTPDGKYVVSGGGDGTVRLWNLATGEQVRKFEGHKLAVFSIAVAPDGKYVVSGSRDKTVRVWYIGDLK
jgi:hypothetical protein